MVLKSGHDIAVRMQKLERALSSEEMKKRLHEVGTAITPLATKAAAADLGADSAFSGWAKIGPLQAKFSPAGDSAIVIHRTRLSAGGWTVATLGRNQGGAGGGFHGPGINSLTGVTARTKSGGLRKVRARKGRRWNGTTEGKGTWDKAADAMQKAAPPILTRLNRQAVIKAFTGG